MGTRMEKYSSGNDVTTRASRNRQLYEDLYSDTSYNNSVVLDDSKESIKTTLAEKKVSADSTIAVTAMDKLREKYGMKIVDSEINEKYKKYINYQLNNKNN